MIGALSAAYIAPHHDRHPAAAFRINVPVRPLLLPAMVFKHIRAVPARAGEDATPAHQIQLLEGLIEQLIGRKGGQPAPRTVSGGDLPSLIAEAGARLQATARSLSVFLAGMLPAAGFLVNRLA